MTLGDNFGCCGEQRGEIVQLNLATCTVRAHVNIARARTVPCQRRRYLDGATASKIIAKTLNNLCPPLKQQRLSRVPDTLWQDLVSPRLADTNARKDSTCSS